MSTLADDAPVTVLVEGMLVHARVRGPKIAGAYGTLRHGVGGLVAVQDIHLADEGSGWCRGHVSEKDPAGAALLVAGALAPNRTGSLREWYPPIF